MVAVAQSRPQVDPPGRGPAGRLIAANFQRPLAAAASSGCAPDVDLVAGKQAEQVRDVAVVVSGACMSQSSSHSCSWPLPPICIGASRARGRGPLLLQVRRRRPACAPPRRRCANSSRRIWLSMVGPGARPTCQTGAGSRATARGGDQPAVRRLLDQGVQKELRGAFEQRVDAVADTRDRRCIRSGPRAAGSARPRRSATCPYCGPSIGPVARHRSVLWCATQPRAPYMSRAVLAPVTDRSDTIAVSGSMRLGEVGRERRPVVHLRVDVDRVLAAPGRRQAVVPDALEVGRLAARDAS